MNDGNKKRGNTGKIITEDETLLLVRGNAGVLEAAASSTKGKILSVKLCDN
jgi:hypothetical protein